MNDQIFLLDDNNLSELRESSFANEVQFQELLQKHPNLLAGSQINPDNPRKWILISREAGIPNEDNGGNIWSVDHLFVDQDGIPTLVEVKRSTDTRLRREVVGQMLDYAANCVNYWTVSEIAELFEKNCEMQDINPDAVLSEFIENSSKQDEFWQRVDTNLRAGKIRLLFVTDQIPRELKRIIEFLNEQMAPAEVLGLELKQFSNGNLKTLVPRILGHTFASDNKKSMRRSKQWDEVTFFKELERRNGNEAAKAIQKIIETIKPNVSRIWFGQGVRSGSLIPVIDSRDHMNSLFAVYTYGKIELFFQYLKDKPPFNDLAKRKDLMRRLNDIDGVNVTANKIDKRPSIDIKLFSKNEKRDAFVAIIAWMIKEIKKIQE